MLFEIIGIEEASQRRVQTRLEFPSIEGVYAYAEKAGVRLESVAQLAGGAAMSSSAYAQQPMGGGYGAPPLGGSFAGQATPAGFNQPAQRRQGIPPAMIGLMALGGVVLVILAVMMMSNQAQKRKQQEIEHEIISQLSTQYRTLSSELDSLISQANTIRAHREQVSTQASTEQMNLDAYKKENWDLITAYEGVKQFGEINENTSLGEGFFRGLIAGGSLRYAADNAERTKQVINYCARAEEMIENLKNQVASDNSRVSQADSAIASKRSECDAVAQQIRDHQGGRQN